MQEEASGIADGGEDRLREAIEAQVRWIIAKVNTEELPALAQRLRVSAIRTLVLFPDGRQLARRSGAAPASAIRQFIEQPKPGLE